MGCAISCRRSRKGKLLAEKPRKTPARSGGKGNNIQAVQTAIDVLRSVSAIRHPALLREIAEKSGLSASRTHRYLTTLCDTGLVTQDPASGRYNLGPTLLELGVQALGRVDPIRLGCEALLELNERTGLDSHLNTWGTNGPTVVKWEPGHFGYAVRIREGRNLPLLLTATGRIFLTYLPEADTAPLVERELAMFGGKTKARKSPEFDVEAIRKTVRQHGIAQSLGEMNSSIAALSAPVFDRDNRLCVSLTVLGLSQSFSTDIDGDTATHVREVARNLSRSLGATNV